MDMYEEAVMWYVCAGNQRFVCPQYWVRNENKDWSCPDFVALDLKDKCVFIVEVTTGTDLSGIADKIKKKDVQWIDHTKNQLPEPFRNWDFHVAIFVRDKFVELLDNKIGDNKNYKAFGLEKIFHNWNWEWDKSLNLPVNPLK